MRQVFAYGQEAFFEGHVHALSDQAGFVTGATLPVDGGFPLA